ncbi:hypothetical protein SELMODRAFT_416787 [Selaginella moellendorffii]|uniref:Uncharacterized protein n=1 Tax=Selaginella moellendorffii TaxID=88036 RepID=D8S0E9_SELML|nr:hypothetical protein SELMODRAFT_416787 [Selaginella moellendorffii]
MALTCSAPPPAQRAQVRELMVEVLNRVRNHRNNLAIVGEPITWVATLAEDVRVWVQVRVMDEFWHEDRDGICSTPSNRLAYPFRDLLNSVLEMTESVREQLIDREFWYGYVEVVFQAFGIVYRIERDRSRDRDPRTSNTELFRQCPIH